MLLLLEDFGSASQPVRLVLQTPLRHDRGPLQATSRAAGRRGPSQWGLSQLSGERPRRVRHRKAAQRDLPVRGGGGRGRSFYSELSWRPASAAGTPTGLTCVNSDIAFTAVVIAGAATICRAAKERPPCPSTRRLITSNGGSGSCYSPALICRRPSRRGVLVFEGQTREQQTPQWKLQFCGHPDNSTSAREGASSAVGGWGKSWDSSRPYHISNITLLTFLSPRQDDRSKVLLLLREGAKCLQRRLSSLPFLSLF